MKTNLFIGKASGLLYTLLFAGLLASAMAPMVGHAAAIGIAAGVSALGSIAASFATPVNGALHSEIAKQIFETELMKQLWPDNRFYSRFRTDVAALDAETVFIPQENRGAIGVYEDPTELPLKLTTRENTVSSYSVTELITDPQIISKGDQRTLSYDKMTAAGEQHGSTLENRAAIIIHYGITPTVASGRVIRTTGSATPGKAPGATGNRLALQEADIAEAAALFEEGDVPMDGAIMLVTPRHMKQIRLIDGFKAYDKTGIAGLVTTGAIGELYGFEIIVRSSYTVFDTDGNKKVRGAAAVASDCLGIVFCQPRLCRMAKAPIDIAMDPYNRPDLAHGRSLNARTVVGAAPSYSDYLGVVALVEGASS